MILIVCLDDRNGMLFNNRRQSRDACLIRDMLAFTAGKKLWVDGYSAKLFDEASDPIVVSDDPLHDAPADGFCFAEKGDISSAEIHQLVVYRWNRSYPADVKFPAEILEKGKLQSSVEFPGSSHERITREVYIL